MNITHIIVYGTLMCGQRAASLMSKCELEGTLRVPGHMYDLVGFPGIKLGGSGKFYGELYKLPGRQQDRRATLISLDQYEGEGALYNRKAIMVTHAGRRVISYIYEFKGELPVEDLIPSGNWIEHSRKRAGG